jgi:hypothetical protein
VIENGDQQHQQMLINGVNLLNVCVNGLLVQFNWVVGLLFEENQRFIAEFQRLKKEDTVRARNIGAFLGLC